MGCTKVRSSHRGTRRDSSGLWKRYPVAGTALTAVGLALLSRLDPVTPLWLVGAYMAVLGVGFGLTMQVLVLAVQNVSAQRDMGVATAASTFFRSMGGAVGVAVFGAVLNLRLGSAVPRLLAERGITLSGDDELHLFGTPDSIAALPGPVRDVVVQAFTEGLNSVFLVGPGRGHRVPGGPLRARGPAALEPRRPGRRTRPHTRGGGRVGRMTAYTHFP